MQEIASKLSNNAKKSDRVVNILAGAAREGSPQFPLRVHLGGAAQMPSCHGGARERGFSTARRLRMRSSLLPNVNRCRSWGDPPPLKIRMKYHGFLSNFSVQNTHGSLIR
jgi:hypothetical protein